MSTWAERAPEIQKMLDSNPPVSYGEMARHFGCKRHVLRSKLKQLRDKGLIHYEDRDTHHDDYEERKKQATLGYKSSMEITKDGSYVSDQPLWMTLDQVKDPAYIMKAHGFLPSEWELVTVKNNVWNTNDKIHGIQTLYASKITVKPRVNGFNYDDLLSVIRADVKPIQIEYNVEMLHSERMLELPIYDAHFGNALYSDYKETQRLAYDLIKSKHWEEILFVVGSDLFHADNFKSTTVNGTQLETVNMPKAWADCDMFYSVLIETAMRQSNLVKIVYIPGNHDQSFGWCFVQYLKAKYPQADIDDRVRERKVVTYGRNFIGLAHGDKSRKDLIRIFPAEFPIEWSQTTNRSAHIGHLHREEEVRTKDEFGLTIRTLSTRNPIDAYHDANGYVTAHRRFMLFEYDQETLRHIHYV